MKQNYKKVGEIVELIDERNKSLVSTEVFGISIDKEFMPSVANTIGTDLSNYKLLKKNRFACNPMHVGRDERLPVSLYNKEIPAIVSPAYFMFEIADTNSVLPEYLMLNFKRADFDRNCWFRTDGSVRGGIAWGDLCELELPVPDLTEQQRIVNAYNTVDRRIRLLQQINEKLEETAQCLFDELNKDKDPNDKLANIAEINSGKRPDDLREGKIPLVGAGDIMGYVSDYNYDEKTLVIGRVGTHGKVQRFNDKCWCSDNTLTIKSKFFEYTYFILKNIDYSLLNRGSTQPLITQTDMKDFGIYFDKKEVQDFEDKVIKIMLEYDEHKLEIEKLQNLKQLLISQISGM